MAISVTVEKDLKMTIAIYGCMKMFKATDSEIWLLQTIKASDTLFTLYIRVCHLLSLFVKLLFTMCRHALDLLHVIHNTFFFIKLKKQEVLEGIKFRDI